MDCPKCGTAMTVEATEEEVGSVIPSTGPKIIVYYYCPKCGHRAQLAKDK